LLVEEEVEVVDEVVGGRFVWVANRLTLETEDGIEMDFWLNLVGIEDELENEIVEKEEEEHRRLWRGNR
jgi:hypothetical protein